VLSLLKPRSYISGGFEVGGDVAIQFPKHQGIKCYAVVSGQCWLSVEGVPDAVLLTAGDCFLLPRGLPFCLATDLSLTPVDYRAFLPEKRNSDAAPHKEGGRYVVGGHFILTGSHAEFLLKSLPPIVHIRPGLSSVVPAGLSLEVEFSRRLSTPHDSERCVARLNPCPSFINTTQNSLPFRNRPINKSPNFLYAALDRSACAPFL
jgi:hypothetical protein